MDLLFFIFNLVWVGFWFWVGVKLYNRAKKHNQSEILKQIQYEEILKKVEMKKILTMKTETHQGQIYAFDIYDDTFIAQGNSIDDLADTAYKFRKVDLAFVNHNKEEFWFVNGKVSKTNINLL